MRCRRRSLSEERRYLNVLRELKADGVDVEISEELLECVRPLDVAVAPSPASFAVELPSGRLAYVLGVGLRSRQRCGIERCDMVVPWDDEIVIEEINFRHPTWSIESLVVTGREFINYRIETGLSFSRADERIEGFILGSGISPVPREYATGRPFPITVTFSDIYGETSSAQARIFLDSAKNGLKMARHPEPHSGSFRQRSTDANSTTSTQPLASAAKTDQKAKLQP